MIKTIRSMFLACVLLAVSFSGCTPALTPTFVPTTVVPSAITPSPIPPTFTAEPPAIDESIKAAIGQVEYSEIKTGEISGPDYISGRMFEGTVDAKDITLTATFDTNNPYSVTAEAMNNSGQKIKVFWNTEQNYWAKYDNINTNLLDYKNYSVFKNIFGMVANGDFNRYMSAVGIGTEAFPANTEQSRNWVVVNKHGVVGSDFVDYFLYLDSSRMNQSIMPERVGQENYMDIDGGSFHKGNEPFKPAAVVKGLTADNKPVYIVTYVWQNADGKNIVMPLGFDERLFQYMFTPLEEADNIPGKDLAEEILIQNFYKLVPIIPTGNANDWNSYGRHNGNNGFIHTLNGGGSFSHRDDVVVGMQVPGDVFGVLPADMQNTINLNLDLIRTTNPTTDKYRAVMFPDGTIPPELALKLSRTISETAFADGSVNP